MMTIRQLVNVVAYLTSLKSGGTHDHGKAMDTSGHDMLKK
jgi:hypothetical protein